METQRCPTTRAILRKTRAGGMKLSDFRLCCRTAVWCWHRDRNTDQCRRVESPERNLAYGCLMFDKGGKNIQWGKATSGAGKTGQLTCKRMKLEHLLTPYTKINSKWIKGLNVRPETMKLLEENRQNI